MDSNILNQVLAQKGFVSVLVIIISALVIQLVLSFIFHHIFHIVEKKPGQIPTRRDLRAKTLLRVTDNVVSAIVVVIALVTMLRVAFNIDVTAFIASATVIGIAVGFGAQQLVKDLINGISFLYQDQFGEGDYILANGIVGKINNISLRTITLTDLNGALTVLENGNILQVTNYSKETYHFFIDFTVPNSQKIDDILTITTNAIKPFADFAQLLGVEDIAGGNITIRIQLQYAFEEYLNASRKIRYALKKTFEDKGIQIS